MITRLRVKNYRCFEDFDWRPEQICLLIGQNGTGKSTLFELLAGLRQVLSRKQTIASMINRTSQTRGSADGAPIEVELELLHQQSRFVYRLRVELKRSGEPKELNEWFGRDGRRVLSAANGIVKLHESDTDLVFSLDSGLSVLGVVSDSSGYDSLQQFRLAIRGLFVYFPNPALIKARGGVGLDLALAPDAANLISWLRVREAFKPVEYVVFLDQLRVLLSGLNRLEFMESNDESTLRLHFANGRDFDFSELSDGQQALIALCALIWGNDLPPEILLLDEPENFLALSEIQPLVHTLVDSAHENGRQLIIASHHPELFNLMAQEHGVVLLKDEKGNVLWKGFKDSEEYGLSPAEVIARGWETD